MYIRTFHAWPISCLIISLSLFSLSTLSIFLYLSTYLFYSILIYILIISFRSEKTIRLNFEDLKSLDALIIDGYDDWVDAAPDHWKLDGFLQNRSPIVVTSRFGQNSRIATPGNEDYEAHAWQLERDYSKLAFFTFALATSIKCVLLPSIFFLSLIHLFFKMHRSRRLVLGLK